MDIISIETLHIKTGRNLVFQIFIIVIFSLLIFLFYFVASSLKGSHSCVQTSIATCRCQSLHSASGGDRHVSRVQADEVTYCRFLTFLQVFTGQFNRGKHRLDLTFLSVLDLLKMQISYEL